jgi:branched-chain amino acid aminotransferase
MIVQRLKKEAKMVQITATKEVFPKTSYPLNPKFGTIFTPYLLKMQIDKSQTQSFRAEIVPYKEEPFWPGTAALHYGQSIFEGLKAYALNNGNVALFRADLHAERMKLSAERMAMGSLQPQVFIECLKAYVEMLKDHVPREDGHSLYLRPLLFAYDPVIKVGSSQKYMFYIMSTIAGNYFSTGGKAKPVRVLINRLFVRAYPGGTGEAKTAGNYAASIWPQTHAQKLECDQVLFLDAVKHEFIDEMGGMNFFIMKGNELITPSLNGCILNGVTRRSILELAPQLGLKPIERPISLKELLDGVNSGEINEAFACGTAAVISPIGEFLFQENLNSQGTIHKLKGDSEVSLRILSQLSKIQRGLIKAPGEWLMEV